MNKQEIFNKVYKHLLKQKKKSVFGIKVCCYRGFDETKCAIGCLIEDYEYSELMEGLNVHALLLRHPGLRFAQSMMEDGKLNEVNNETLKLCNYLQSCHDESDPSRWRSDLNEIAKLFNLTVPQ